jgi:hypothetical protein
VSNLQQVKILISLFPPVIVYPNEYKSFSKMDELNRTKIYSAETKELLGEFSMELSENATPKEIFKSVLTSYKFYNPKRGKSNLHRNPM